MIFPELLKQGDKISIVAPAGRLKKGAMDEAIEKLNAWGLQVILSPHVYNTENYFAGQDNVRLGDIQLALDDPDIRAVLCARGGYGVTRILKQIDLKTFAQKPKWIIGFSDITALLIKSENYDVASIHGPMGTSFVKGSKIALGSLKELLFTGTNSLVAHEPGLRTGSVAASITGGNLSLIIDSLGTDEEIDTRNKILFIEEVGEQTYKIDRMFQHLLRAEKLDKLAGLAIGHFSGIDDKDTSFGETWREVITHITTQFSFPVGFGFNIGHEPNNMPLVIGGQYQFNVGAESSILTLTTSF